MESGFRRRNIPRDYFTFSRYTFIPRFYSTGTPTQKLHSRNGKYPRSLWPDRFLKKEKLENGLGQIQWLRLWKKFAMTNHLVYQYTLPWIQESKINQFLYRTMFRPHLSRALMSGHRSGLHRNPFWGYRSSTFWFYFRLKKLSQKLKSKPN